MHKCVRCGITYEDNDATILRGCTGCGGIFFLYVKSPDDIKRLDVVEKELRKKDTTLEKELSKQIKERKRSVRKKVAIKKKPRIKKPKRARKEARAKKEARVKKEVRVRKEVIRIGQKKYAIEDIFGIETVRIPKDGVYEINIDALMKKRPVIVLERKRVYFIHLPLLFEELGVA